MNKHPFQIPTLPTVVGNGLGHEPSVGHFHSGRRKEKQAAASKQAFPQPQGSQEALLSWDSVQGRFHQQGGSLRGGWLCLPAVVVLLMLLPHVVPTSQGWGWAAPTSDPNLFASLNGLNCQVSECLQSNGRAADSNVVLVTI